MKESTTLIIDFEPIGRRVEITPGVSLLEAAQSAGVELISICGGQGSCKCKTLFLSMSVCVTQKEIFHISYPISLFFSRPKL